MKVTNGKIIILIGTIHTILTLMPFVYGEQFKIFGHQYFFKINDGFLESGQMDYETFAAFWCFFFGILLFPLGFLLEYVEKNSLTIPRGFMWSHLIVILLGVYMIPLGGFTIFMLPHAIYMLIKNSRRNGVIDGTRSGLNI
jgi:hypothetical protein